MFVSIQLVINSTWLKNNSAFKTMSSNYDVFISLFVCITLCEKCPYSEFFWSLISRIQIEYGEIGLSFGIQSECGKYGPEKLQLRTPFTQCYLWFRKFSENAIISRKNILCLNIRSHEKYLDRCVWNICKIKTHIIFERFFVH